MSVRNQNWYTLQSTRRYPIADQSTGVSDTGDFIRDSILVDCQLRYPETLGQYVYVQGITCSDGLVTIVFGVAGSLDATDGTTLAAVSLPKPLAQNVHHAVKALVPGVAGWVVFGAGVNEKFTGRYSTPRQTQLLARNARGYRELPIPSLGKLGVGTSLQGIVTLTGQAPVTITQEIVNADGEDVPALVFRLATADSESNPLQTYLGECGQRPESNTCPKQPIETINGVGPDCNGNINFVFDGFDAYPYADCGGIDIISSTGLSEACNQGVTRRHRSPVDNCGNDDYNPLDQLQPDVFSSESLPDLGIYPTCLLDATTLCYQFDRSGFDASYYGVSGQWKAIDGLFVMETTSSPAYVCTAVAGVYPPPTKSIAAADIVGPNLLIYRNCAAPPWMEHRFLTRMKITADGLKRNGGFFFNYAQELISGHAIKTYFVAILDATEARIKIMRFNGTQFIVEHSEQIAIQVGEWYDLDMRLHNTGSAIAVTATGYKSDGSSGAVTCTVAIPYADYGPATGHFGLYTNRSYTYFNSVQTGPIPID